MGHFLQFFCVFFKKTVKISGQELSFNHFVRECLISEDLLIIRKTQTPFWPAFIQVVPLKILKRHYNAFEAWTLPNATHYNLLKKQVSHFASLVALIFPPEFFVLSCDFSPASFLDRIIREMILSSHLPLCKENICPVELQDGPFDHSPSKVPVEDETDEIKT